MSMETLKSLCDKKFGGLHRVMQEPMQTDAGMVMCPKKSTDMAMQGIVENPVENSQVVCLQEGNVMQAVMQADSKGLMEMRSVQDLFPAWEFRELPRDNVTFPAQHRGCGGVFAPVVLRIPGRGDGMMCTKCRKWRRAPAKAFGKGVEV